MSKENSELVMLRLEYDIAKLKHFVYAAEQSEQEASEIIAELKAENVKLKESLVQIKGICKEAIRLCDCPDADANSDCIDCTDGGRASVAKEIMEVLKDE